MAARKPLYRRFWLWAWVSGVAVVLWGGARWWSSHQSAQASHEPQACALPPEASNRPHPDMVWVPPGSFELGDQIYPEESPPQRAQVAGFWMSRTEVTNDEFAAFVAATGYTTQAERPVDIGKHPNLAAQLQQPGAVVFVMPNDVHGLGSVAQWWRYTPGASWRHPGGPQTSIEGKGAFPVVAVTTDDALAYARWRGHSLPSEAQWEWAARAALDQPAPAHEQPRQANTWQGLFPVVNLAEDGFQGLAPVGCYEPNALGLFDMIGNVWELTADAWTAHPRPADHENVPDALAPGMRSPDAPLQVIKGGSFLCAPNYCMRYRAGARQPQERDLAASHLGFRTVVNDTP
jgi:formylglycine-generating enzyme